jgi:signal transduction histidine kinase
MVVDQGIYALKNITEYMKQFDEDLYNIENDVFEDYSERVKDIFYELNNKGDLSKISYEDLRSIADKYKINEIYLINNLGSIFNTTYTNDLNLNLKEISNDMRKFIDAIYGTDVISTHRSLVSRYNKLNKFIYYSPKGSNIILEVSIDMKEHIAGRYSKNYADYLFIDGLQKYIRQNPYLNNVEIYDVTNNVGLSIFLNGKKLENSQVIFDKIRLSPKFKVNQGDKVIVYNMLDHIKQGETYFGKELIIEMEYDFSSINIFARNNIIFAFLSGLLLAIFAFNLLSNYFNKIIAVRITNINKNLNLLEQGVYPKDIVFNEKDEISDIACNINYMKKRIQERERELRNSINELEKTTLALRESNERIEYDKLKTDFFANLSHEFKTPLIILLSSLQLIELYNKNNIIQDTQGKLENYSKIMKQNCYRLLRLINNLIDLTRIDSYFYEVEMHNYDVVKLAEDTVTSIINYAKVKNIKIGFIKLIPEKIIACDPEKIERILLNLISNAIKFTDENGNIEISIGEKDSNIIISVKDDGIGMPEDKLNVIFQRFRQLDKSFSRNVEGSGIGLSLVKALVDMHDGKIMVESKLGKGSMFIVSIPIKVLNEDFITNSNLLGDDKSANRMQIELSDIYS